jgi:uncharacterized protein (TIGR02452 family)
MSRKVSKARGARAELAKTILSIVEDGFYKTGSGTRVDIKAALRDSIMHTVHYHDERNVEEITPKKSISSSSISNKGEAFDKRMQVKDTTTIQAALELISRDNGRVGVMNFASAKNPGGGFLGGSLAQEESICSSSLLYPTLQQFENRTDCYYQINRLEANRGVYTDCALFSPDVPIIRDDVTHVFLDELKKACFLTIPAPNLGVLVKDGCTDARTVAQAALTRRIRKSLAIFASHGCTSLVLSAFGCGVFKNDPDFVASIFRACILNGEFKGIFQEIIFAVLVVGKGSKATVNIDAFRAQFPFSSE